MAELFFIKKYDLVTNTFPPTFPEGLDVEIFTYDSLKFAKKKQNLILKKNMSLNFL